MYSEEGALQVQDTEGGSGLSCASCVVVVGSVTMTSARSGMDAVQEGMAGNVSTGENCARASYGAEFSKRTFSSSVLNQFEARFIMCT